VGLACFRDARRTSKSPRDTSVALPAGKGSPGPGEPDHLRCQAGRGPPTLPPGSAPGGVDHSTTETDERRGLPTGPGGSSSRLCGRRPHPGPPGPHTSGPTPTAKLRRNMVDARGTWGTGRGSSGRPRTGGLGGNRGPTSRSRALEGSPGGSPFALGPRLPLVVLPIPSPVEWGSGPTCPNARNRRSPLVLSASPRSGFPERLALASRPLRRIPTHRKRGVLSSQRRLISGIRPSKKERRASTVSRSLSGTDQRRSIRRER